MKLREIRGLLVALSRLKAAVCALRLAVYLIPAKSLPKRVNPWLVVPRFRISNKRSHGLARTYVLSDPTLELKHSLDPPSRDLNAPLTGLSLLWAPFRSSLDKQS